MKERKEKGKICADAKQALSWPANAQLIAGLESQGPITYALDMADDCFAPARRVVRSKPQVGPLFGRDKQRSDV